MIKRLIFEIDEELHRQIKTKAASNGQTIKGYVINLIRKDLETKKDIR